MTNQPAPASAVPTETAWDKIIGRPDKPFHKPECCCAECEVWKAANPSPPAEPAEANEKLRNFRLNYDPALLAAFPLETDAPRLAAELATARQENERLREHEELVAKVEVIFGCS